MARVFVVQNQPSKNVFLASSYGKIEFIFEKDDSIVSSEGCRKAFEKVRQILLDLKFTSDDFIIPIGDPSLIGVVCIAASQVSESFRMLKWDRQSSTYFEVLISQ